MAWSRRVKGITSELRYQAAKPTGAPGADSQPLEYFTIKDWLVAGPYNLEDPVKDFDRDFLDGEAKVEPAKDAKAGTAVWKPLRVGIETQSRHEHNEGTCGQSYVDFLFTFGKITVESNSTVKIEGDFTNKVAYAHTYIHSPPRPGATASSIRWCRGPNLAQRQTHRPRSEEPQQGLRGHAGQGLEPAAGEDQHGRRAGQKLRRAMAQQMAGRGRISRPSRPSATRPRTSIG
jgi:hypothetical protein